MSNTSFLEWTHVGTANTTPAIIQAANNQVLPVTEWRNSNSEPLISVSSFGMFNFHDYAGKFAYEDEQIFSINSERT